MRAIIVALSIFILGGLAVLGQTTAFTYQGRLTDGTLPASGTYQMRFSLFDAATGGTQDGATNEVSAVQVENGAFTVQLDFGSSPFPFGGNRFLQVEVRRSASEAYTPLTPRQQITTAPYAIRSLIANTAENSNRLGDVSSSQFVQTTDPRLSNARTPTSGSNSYIQNRTTTQGSSNFDISGTGEASILNARTHFSFNGSRILSALGTNNTFVGNTAGNSIANGVGNGERNTFVGHGAGNKTTNGDRNTFVGSGAGFDNLQGNDNSFYGFNTGLRVTLGGQNSLFGVSAGNRITDANDNAIFGFEAGTETSGSGNSFFGARAGRNVTTGFNNVIVGNSAGLAITTGSRNTLIGNNTNVASSDVTRAVAIGDGATAAFSNSIFIGTSTETVFIPGDMFVDNRITSDFMRSRFLEFGNRGGSFTVCHENGLLQTCLGSSARYKENIIDFDRGWEFVKKLRPVYYNYKDGGLRDIGLIAEEVNEVDPRLIYAHKNGTIEGVKYDRIGVLLIDVVKDQQAQIEAQQEELLELKRIVCSIKPDASVCKEVTK